jgi:exodeoxyribonuclease VII small subunit
LNPPPFAYPKPLQKPTPFQSFNPKPSAIHKILHTALENLRPFELFRFVPLCSGKKFISGRFVIPLSLCFGICHSRQGARGQAAQTPFTRPLPSSIVPGMSKPVKAAGPETPAAAELSFEDALKKLGSIVQAMENDDLPLEKLLTQYEEGMRMYQTCQTRLATAELRIQQIERDAAGRIQARPLDIAPTNPEL